MGSWTQSVWANAAARAESSSTARSGPAAAGMVGDRAMRAGSPADACLVQEAKRRLVNAVDFERDGLRGPGRAAEVNWYGYPAPTTVAVARWQAYYEYMNAY